jgi:predicted DsbA family dithiol-disulfide isomerase
VSYEIHPETPVEGVLLERLFGPGVRQSQEGQRRRCAELGLPFEPPQVLSNSRLAVEAAEFARDAGRHAEFHRALLGAYFTLGRDIGDLEVLSGLAAETGLDPVALRAQLAAGAYSSVREDAYQEARALGITGVPTFIFAGGVRVVGAQPLEYFRRVLEEMVLLGGQTA